MLPESQNEKKINISEKKPQVNPYYLVLSGKFKTAKLIVLCCLVVFLLATILLFREEITVDNFRYLIKDLEIGDNTGVNFKDEITYDSDTQIKLELYKGDIVIVGSSYFYLTDLQGNKRLNEGSKFSNPVVLSSDKYLLVYGLSETTYRIYNTFTALHTESFDYPITGAAVSDKGYYAIVTRTAEYRSVVYLYNESFERIGALYKDKYITDVAFNDDGSELLVVSLFTQNGDFATEIVNYVPFSDKPSSTLVVNGSMPIEASYNEDDGFSVIYHNKIEFYDSEYVLRNTYNFSANMVPITTCIDRKYTAVTYNENIVGDDIRVLVFDNSGKKVLDVQSQGQPKRIKILGDYVFVLLDGKLCKIDIKKSQTTYYDIEKNPIGLLLVNQKTALVYFSDHTSKVNVE